MNRAFLCLFLCVSLLGGCLGRGGDYDPQAEIDRQGMARAQAEREAKFPASHSYLLKLTMVRDGKEDMATADIQRILSEVLQSEMGNTGLNPDRGANSGGGELGVIAVRLTAEQSEYGDGGTRVFVPTKFDVDMTVTSEGAACGWEGEHSLSFSKAAPSRVRGSSDREAQIRTLSEGLVEKLPSF